MRGRSNALWQFEEGYRNYSPVLANEWDTQTRTERYTIGATMNYQPFDWLSNRLILGLDNANRQVDDFTSPDSRTSSYNDWLKAMSPDFEAAYAAEPAWPARPEIEQMLTIAPVPRSISVGRTS